MEIEHRHAGKPAALLLARAAIAAAPLEEMARLTAALRSTGEVGEAVYGFADQGAPSFREIVHRLVEDGWRDVVILPLMTPLEPSYLAFIARTLQRWHIEAGGEWPRFRIGRGLSELDDPTTIVEPMLRSALAAPPINPSAKAATEGSVVSDRKYRVLVCGGGPCTQAGSAAVWSHLRARQGEMKLSDQGTGMRSAKATCLGPCGLAPVVQVYPEGVFYGGVTEAGIDRIIEDHLVGGDVVESLAYHPAPGKQMLRP